MLQVNRKGRRHIERLGGRLMPNSTSSEFRTKDLALVRYLVEVQLGTMEWALINPEVEDEGKKEDVITAFERLCRANEALGSKLASD